jgi:hypothetical protein
MIANEINKARQVMKKAVIDLDKIKVVYERENSFRVWLKFSEEELSLDISKKDMIEIANWALNLFIED